MKHLTVDGGNVRAEGVDAGKLRRLGIVVERDVIGFDSVPALLKAGVIEFTASIERENAGLLKGGIGFLT
ncbi:MAG: hypothetical protein IPO77_17175 [Acidobacteria bacterium]|nr:hypothetical protein [Acidobacteriota bacterium]